jgi:hypothetical protein
MFDRRIGLTRSRQIQYVVVGKKIWFIWGPSSRLHVCNGYPNILITLIISGIGKICQVLTSAVSMGYSQYTTSSAINKVDTRYCGNLFYYEYGLTGKVRNLSLESITLGCGKIFSILF